MPKSQLQVGQEEGRGLRKKSLVLLGKWMMKVCECVKSTTRANANSESQCHSVSVLDIKQSNDAMRMCVVAEKRHFME